MEILIRSLGQRTGNEGKWGKALPRLPKKWNTLVEQPCQGSEQFLARKGGHGEHGKENLTVRMYVDASGEENDLMDLNWDCLSRQRLLEEVVSLPQGFFMYALCSEHLCVFCWRSTHGREKKTHNCTQVFGSEKDDSYFALPLLYRSRQIEKVSLKCTFHLLDLLLFCMCHSLMWVVLSFIVCILAAKNKLCKYSSNTTRTKTARSGEKLQAVILCSCLVHAVWQMAHAIRYREVCWVSSIAVVW